MEKQQRELYEWELFGSEEIYHHPKEKFLNDQHSVPGKTEVKTTYKGGIS
jgi:hypothetical protein